MQITYADGLQNLAPQDDCDAAAALHSNYPGELTDGTACCTSMTVGDIEVVLDGTRESFDTIIGSDTPIEERCFVSVGHSVGTLEQSQPLPPQCRRSGGRRC